MEKITKTYDVYKFEELEKNIQDDLLEKQMNYQKEFYIDTFLLADMSYKAEELLQKYFKNNKAELKNVYYDLSYSQGSGAMIEFSLYYYNKFINVKQYGYYNHERSFIIDTYELTEKQEEQLKNKIIKMNIELKKYGYAIIESDPDKDQCLEILKDQKYLKDGEVFG